MWVKSVNILLIDNGHLWKYDTWDDGIKWSLSRHVSISSLLFRAEPQKPLLLRSLMPYTQTSGLWMLTNGFTIRLKRWTWNTTWVCSSRWLKFIKILLLLRCHLIPEMVISCVCCQTCISCRSLHKYSQLKNGQFGRDFMSQSLVMSRST